MCAKLPSLFMRAFLETATTLSGALLVRHRKGESLRIASAPDVDSRVVPCPAVPGCVSQINRPSKYDATAAYMLGPTDPDPSLDLSKVTIIPPTPAEAAQAGAVAVAGAAPVVGPDGQVHGQPGKYEANDNTLYIGGLPVEWTHDQVWNVLGVWGFGSAWLGAGRHQHPRQLITVLRLWCMAFAKVHKVDAVHRIMHL